MAPGRLFSEFVQLGRFAVVSPKTFLSAAHTSVRAMLDFAFDRLSPLPTLPQNVSAQLASNSVMLLPASTFAAGNQEVTGLMFLASLAKAIKARVIFEIGTYNGITALTLARNIPGATVHTLDLPPGAYPALPVFHTDPAHFDNFARRVYEGEPEEHRIVQHFGDSANFDFSPYQHTCQVVYVDGAHSYEYVANDTRVAFRLVEVEEVAAIVWDDYWRHIPDIPRFLNSLEKHNLFRVPNSRLVVWLSDRAIALLQS
jgi:hypothetical protein